MKIVYILGLSLILWTFLAQSCMTFRMNDKQAVKKFSDQGIPLFTKTLQVSVGSNAHHIHFAQTGNDNYPTLVFVHGTPGSWDAFVQYMQDTALLKKYRMVAVDRPGFGYSDFGKVFNLAVQSEILNAWLKKLENGKPVYLVGHSLGGPMIVKMAADEPSSYQGLVIISGSLDPSEEKSERWRLLYKTPFNYFIPGAFKPSNEELWYLKKDLVNLEKDFGRVTCPVYFVHGENDSWVPPGNVAYGKKLLVHASTIGVLMLPGGNHFIPWTRYREIREVLLKLGNFGISGFRD